MTEITSGPGPEALSPWRRFRYWLHVNFTCPNCKRYLQQLRAAIALLGRLPRERAPDATVEAVLAKLA